MPGCGYICPKCNDTGFDEALKPCDWCSPSTQKPSPPEITDEEWFKAVHEGTCCGDIGRMTQDKQIHNKSN